jgi:hypothetical protein
MAVAFREVFSAFGVDADGDKPRMMVPLHGKNLVALEGDPDLVLVPGRDSLKVEKLEKVSWRTRWRPRSTLRRRAGRDGSSARTPPTSRSTASTGREGSTGFRSTR